MEEQSFVNFYDVLGLRDGASFEAVGACFRRLARRFHPDNQDTGDRSQFDAVVKAHDVLKDPAKRAQYHIDNPGRLPPFEGVKPPNLDDTQTDTVDEVEESASFDGFGIDKDISIQNNLLVLLYVRRRRNIKEPGMGNIELELLSGCPGEYLEFHIWYLKEKGWIATGEDGLLAITIDGVERAANIYKETAHRLIADQS